MSHLPRLVLETKKDLAEAGLKSTIVGHVGDGNFHALILFHSPEELQSVSEAVHRLVHRAIGMDGTCKLKQSCYFACLSIFYSTLRYWRTWCRSG